jgi:hypothetical protein
MQRRLSESDDGDDDDGTSSKAIPLGRSIEDAMELDGIG